jgi:hypothetical protein
LSITTTNTKHASSKNNKAKTERQSSGTKSTFSTMPIEKNTESTTSTIISTTEQFTVPTKDNEKIFSQTKGTFTTTGINQVSVSVTIGSLSVVVSEFLASVIVECGFCFI